MRAKKKQASEQGQAKTRGWMISELERRGVHVRGKPEAASDTWLARKLQELGVNVSAGPKDSKAQEEDRQQTKEWGGDWGGSFGPLFDQEGEG